nr:insulin-degrading enzyme, IDE, atrial natriuretic peptide (ANP)-binding protein=peptide 3 {EC 3.4.22.11} [rats, brain, Peptide Partial, 11 aa] [Rattus sp.]
AEGPQEFVFQE